MKNFHNLDPKQNSMKVQNFFRVNQLDGKNSNPLREIHDAHYSSIEKESQKNLNNSNVYNSHLNQPILITKNLPKAFDIKENKSNSNSLNKKNNNGNIVFKRSSSFGNSNHQAYNLLKVNNFICKNDTSNTSRFIDKSLKNKKNNIYILKQDFSDLDETKETAKINKQNNLNSKKIKTFNNSNANYNNIDYNRTQDNFSAIKIINNNFNEIKITPINLFNNITNNNFLSKNKSRLKPLSVEKNRNQHSFNQIDFSEIIETQKPKINLNEGINYKFKNGYKYHFNLSKINCYFLKEIKISNISNEFQEEIKTFCSKIKINKNYLKIIDYKLNYPENYNTIVVEYPTGGENLFDIVRSAGFYDEKNLISIILVILKNLIEIQNEDNFINVPFCLCDIFYNIKDHIKIIPPIIRKMNFNDNNKNNLCICKKVLLNLKKFYKDNNNISSLCLSFFIMQLITQNLIFELKSFEYLINIQKERQKCCLVHLLLDIEKKFFNSKKDLLFSSFLKLYPVSLIYFIHECSLFENNEINFSTLMNQDLMNIYEISEKISVSKRELIKIVSIEEENKFCKLENFLKKFRMIYKNLNIDPGLFNKKLQDRKIISNLSRAFNVDKRVLINKIINIIEQ